MKKRLFIAACIVIGLILLFPLPLRYKDGGTVEFRALLYSITNYHAMEGDGYLTGIKIKILGMTVYENTAIEK